MAVCCPGNLHQVGVILHFNWDKSIDWAVRPSALAMPACGDTKASRSDAPVMQMGTAAATENDATAKISLMHTRFFIGSFTR